MGLIIESGTGTGYSAKVNSNNRLTTQSVTVSTEHSINHSKGKAFNLMFSATPTNGTNPFLYFKNTSDDDICVERFTLHLVANEYVDVKLNDTGTPVDGTAIVPANLNTGSGITAIGTFQNANAITALSGGTIVQRIYHVSSAGEENYNFDQDIIIKKNGVLTMYIQTGGTALAGVLIFNYHEKE